MVLNSISVGAAVTPTVIETYLSHYLNRKPLRQKPTAHVSYHEGLNLIRQFLHYASLHTVEDLQSFTSQWVPNPRWVKVTEVAIPEDSIGKAADALITQLGHYDLAKVGGSKWWQWRREGSVLKAEWIEMRSHYSQRKESGENSKRIMLYVHGGAYFFGSVDEHRYQMQRHARKLEARVFARMLVILRDQGFPLPAGAVLISPWVDLTHSFPSLAGDGRHDYIPAHGFMQRPSASWPPPNSDDIGQMAGHAVEEGVGEDLEGRSTSVKQAAIQGFTVEAHSQPVKPGHDLSIMLDGKVITIKDQIQMYASNQLISHPLVSPVLSPSLGGLPPLLILTGGGELLRDEQIYLAHKAANPSKYPPGEAYLDEYPEARTLIDKYKPTDVQLQVWDDLCHVAPTLSFTRPAKYMYRSIAQFGAWALANAQRTDIEIMDDDDVSIITSTSDTGSSESHPAHKPSKGKEGLAHRDGIGAQSIGKAGKPLPPFGKDHMIRQRVDRHGYIFPLEPPSSLQALQMSPDEIGLIKPGPVRKWLAAKLEWDSKFAKEKRKVQRQRIKEMAQGYQGFGDGEVPPPSALAGRRGLAMPKEEKKKQSWGMSIWAIWGSKHDEDTMQREEKADKQPETATATGDGVNDPKMITKQSRSRSRRRTVRYNNIDANNSVVENLHTQDQIKRGQPSDSGDRTTDSVDPSFQTLAYSPKSMMFSDTSENGQTAPAAPAVTIGARQNRPAAGGKLFPFKLGRRLGDDGVNTSTITLTSQAGVVTPKGDEGSRQLGTKAVKNGAYEGSGTGVKDESTSKRPDMERFQTAKEKP